MRRAPAVAAAVALLSGLLAACQSSSPVSSTGPPTTIAATTTTTAPAPALRVAAWSEPLALNWWDAFGSRGEALDRAREQGATASLFSASGLEPVPDLAVLPLAVPRPDGDGWVVDQRIDGSRRWSDGARVRASDLAYYFETVRSMGLDGVHPSFFPPEVSGVEALDNDTVRVRFTTVPGPGLWPGAVGLAPFVPSHFWETAGATDAPSLYSWTDAAPPRASGSVTEWVSAGDRETAYRMLLDGEVDFVFDDRGVDGLGADLAGELAADPAIEMVTSVRTEIRVLAFNQRSAPLDDPAFRRALATVVDRAAIADELGAAVADAFTRPDPGGATGRPAGPGTFDGERLDRSARIDSALAILEEAGYQAASVRAFEILVSEADPLRVAAANAIAERITELGLEVTVTRLSPDELADRVLPPIRFDRAASWDMAVLGWRPTGPDPGDLLIHLFRSDEDSVTGGGINVTGFRSPAFDELISRYLATTDFDRGGAILDQMELMLSAEVPQLPLYRELVVEATRAGLAFGPVTGGIAASPGSWPYPGP